MKKKVLLAFFFIIVSTVVVQSAEQQESAEESKVRAIASTLRCAVCQNQSIYESNSDLAKEMLNIIREKIAKSESDEQIRQYFYTRYGDYIYLEPTHQGSNWLLWLAPWVGFMGGIIGLYLFLRRRISSVSPSPE